MTICAAAFTTLSVRRLLDQIPINTFSADPATLWNDPHFEPRVNLLLANVTPSLPRENDYQKRKEPLCGPQPPLPLQPWSRVIMRSCATLGSLNQLSRSDYTRASKSFFEQTMATAGHAVLLLPTLLVGQSISSRKSDARFAADSLLIAERHATMRRITGHTLVCDGDCASALSDRSRTALARCGAGFCR